MIIYYALTKDSEKGISIHFPDAPAVKAEGKDMGEAIKMATEALSSMLVMGLQGHDYFNPKPYEHIRDLSQEGEDVVPVIVTEEAMARYRYKS